MPSSTPHRDVDELLVLVVDDNETNLKLVREVLNADGLRTIEATSGTDAIAAAVQSQPNLVLLDLGLPDMDGVAVVRELRARQRTARIPVVALTAIRTEGDDGWLRAAGFAACIEKPIDARVFPGQVRSYCSPAAT